MKKLLLLYVIIVTFSCSKQDDNLTNVQSNHSTTKEILSFKSFDDFIKTYNELSKFETAEQFKNWIFEQGHTSLLERLEEEVNDLSFETPLNDQYEAYSTILKSIFNADSEIKIDNNIVTLKDGILFINTDDSESSIIGSIEISNENHNKDSNEELRVFQPNQWVKKTQTFHANNGRV